MLELPKCWGKRLDLGRFFSEIIVSLPKDLGDVKKLLTLAIKSFKL